MTAIWTTQFLGLTSLPVRWSERQVPHRVWSCSAAANEPITALLVGTADGRIEWVKSSQRTDQELVFSLHVTPLDPRYQGVHFQVDAGHAFLQSFYCRTPSGSAQPITELPQSSATGRFVRLARLEGTPTVEVGLLLLARKDVKFGRNALWHLRQPLQTKVGGTVGRILSYGRTGSLLESEWTTNSP
jgi:hypothetical protein